MSLSRKFSRAITTNRCIVSSVLYVCTINQSNNEFLELGYEDVDAKVYIHRSNAPLIESLSIIAHQVATCTRITGSNKSLNISLSKMTVVLTGKSIEVPWQ
jgi:hypothetical protein